MPRLARGLGPLHTGPVHLVAAADKFRGTASAAEVVSAVAAGARRAGWTADEVPLSDGGEGFLEVLGGANRTASVTGPAGDTVEASWRLDGRTAVVEMAAASGLELAGGPDANDPVAATTAGTGELIALAVESGARRVLVGVGGSATTDGGLGALQAMGALGRYRGIELVVACDVRIGFVDAAERFAPQKGASPAQVELLRRRLASLADTYLAERGVDVADLPGAGAAGGLAGGLASAGATLVSGFELVADEVDLDERLEGADLAVTGEGFLDEESFDGKVVGGVCERAELVGVDALAVVGEVVPDLDLSGLGAEARAAAERLQVRSLVEAFGEERAKAETTACIEAVVAEHLAAA